MDKPWRCRDCLMWTALAGSSWLGTCPAIVEDDKRIAGYEAACGVFEPRSPDFGPKETLTVALPPSERAKA